METTLVIKNWLKKDGNTKAKLAVLLDLKSSNTIDQWLSNGKVSHTMDRRVKEVINGNARKSRKG